MKDNIAIHILEALGINPRPEFYAGIGVNEAYLNDEKLCGILIMIYRGAYGKTLGASEYYKMVMEMETLGISEFIERFLAFGDNGFVRQGLRTSKSNIADYLNSDDLYSNIGIVVTAATSDISDREEQIRKTNLIKYNFINDVLSLKERLPESIISLALADLEKYSDFVPKKRNI